VAFGLFIGLFWFAVVALAVVRHEYLGSIVGTVPLAAIFWYRDRLRRAEALKKQITECVTRLDGCEGELRNTEMEAREIEAEIRKLTGRAEVTQADIDARAA